MERIGRYELREKLGQGGMGVVYRAYDTLLQRVVAVKVISATIDGNPDLRERFFREARAAGQLSHRNIITIHDLGEHEGVPYLAMEYLEGEDLQRRMAGHDRMSLSHKLDLAIEVCQGLEFAHTHAVIHRDIKPANIFITDNGTVKLLDFGLARLVTSELTHSNMMMGTLNYMAPEQVRGERADHRSDIFATGVVLYELLSGRKAFQGDSFAATLYKILQEVPEPLDRIDSTLPWQMVAIVERSLSKPRDERYQHMSEMLHDLLTVRQLQQFAESPTGYGSAFSSGLPSPLPQPAPGSVTPRPSSGAQRPSSDAQRPSSGPQRPSSGPQRPSSGARQPFSGEQYSPPDLDVTGVPSPAPTPMIPPVPTPTPSPVVPGARRSRQILIAASVALVAIASAAVYQLVLRKPPESSIQTQAPAPPTRDDPAIQAAVTQSLNAFQSGDYAGALRLADSVLLQVPSHPEARRIAERAKEAADTIERGLRDARSHFDAGRYDDAAEAAGSVLSVSPSNADAKRIMAESTARSRGRAVEDARARMVQARAAAVAAAAPKLASSSYGIALAAEREAVRLQKAGRASDAAAKFYEAGGLFRSAEIAAQTATVVSGPRTAGTTPVERPTSPASTTPTPSVPQPAAPGPETAPSQTVPTIPVTPPERPPVAATPLPLPPPPAPTTTPAPAPASAPPPAQPAPDPAAANAAAETAIREVLTKYELALEGRSMEALKRIWPGLGGAQQTSIRNEFEHARRIDVDVVDPHISVSGTSASVTFTRHYELQPPSGPPQRADSPTTMTLRRTDGGWVIDQIRFGAPR